MDRRSLVVSGMFAAVAGGAARAQGTAADLPRRFAAALNAADMQAFAALFAEDYVNHQTSAAAPAPAGMSQKQASVGFFARRVEALAGLTVGIEASLSQGDLCAASFVYEGVHKGVYFGVAPSGRKLRFTSCDIFRVADGKIAEHWGMGDIAGVLAQLKG
ncbi:MAG: ester cyclase [Pseudomonadota bacterium]|nr:ester cyclase [Pseudomonadota bacterium]